MIKEQSFLLKVLGDFLNARQTLVKEDIKWDDVLLYAKQHNVEGIVYYQCNSFISQDYYTRLSSNYAATLFHYTQRVKILSEVEKTFSKVGIRYLVFKGTKIAEFYPVPALRTMGDCDILVHSIDKEIAHQCLTKLGFVNVFKQGKEWIYYKDTIEFELHDHLLYEEVINTNASKGFTETVWDYIIESENCYELDWSFHFVFLVLHLKKHFLNCGVGFRQFMDLVVIANNVQLDWKWIEAIIDELQLTSFFITCCTLCKRWFDAKMPLDTVLDDQFYLESTEYIFNNGVFGHDNENNDVNPIINQLTQMGKLKTLIYNLFPSYENMRYVPYYSFLNNKPIILPVAWAYRIIRYLKLGKKRGDKISVETLFTLDNSIQLRNEYLKKWGL